MQTLGRMCRALGAIGALTLLLVGIPAALVMVVGLPLPSRAFDLESIRGALDGATVSDDVLIKALACACWLTWALVVSSAVAEGGAWVQRRSARRVPLGGFVQPIVRELIVSATLI